jgi:HPt (histidine-containing phosphotransfer) domain-containing protein
VTTEHFELHNRQLPELDELLLSHEVQALAREEFLSTHSNSAKEIENALAAGDKKTAIHIAHTMRGYASLLSEHGLYFATEEIEASLKKNKNPSEKILKFLSAELTQAISRAKDL